MAEKLAPLAIPVSTALLGPGIADTQRDTPGTADRKLTRNLKRRYDEIHNVPKVGVVQIPSGLNCSLINCMSIHSEPNDILYHQGRFA